MSIKHLLSVATVIALVWSLSGCAAPRSGEPDPQPDEQAFHSAQEHNDRGGAIPSRARED